MTATASSRILILDDDPFMLKLLSTMLTQFGYSQVTCLENGAEALELCRVPESRPDVILLDINMPGMDGVEFVRHLAACAYRGCIILVSGEDNVMLQATERLARNQQLRVVGALPKPPSRDRLNDLLGQCDNEVRAKAKTARKTYGRDEVAAAIAQGQIINYYQPKVVVETGAFLGVETLARWMHPQDGLVFPDQFIPVAEEHGLIQDLTRAVVKGALNQTRSWAQADLHLQVAINVSMQDLGQIDFADWVVLQALASEVQPRQLALELTESGLMHELSTALDVLTRLRLKRFCLSIDDFGNGYSSLVQLRDLPFDQLKIDYGFTHNAWQDPKLRAIFESSLHLAKQLGMEVVAEGVEDMQDWFFLQTTGCDIAQGYFIARPMPADAVLGWSKDWQRRIVEERLVGGASPPA